VSNFFSNNNLLLKAEQPQVNGFFKGINMVSVYNFRKYNFLFFII